jgi:hypothetical protein
MQLKLPGLEGNEMTFYRVFQRCSKDNFVVSSKKTREQILPPDLRAFRSLGGYPKKVNASKTSRCPYHAFGRH